MIFINFNEWLDEYNDYMRLYRMFGDEEYFIEAQEVLDSLRVAVNRMQVSIKIRSGINQDTLRKLKML
ncbi:hypothetical protein O9H85_05480 [Paenibacillus filicis]|uniref:Uncharacterized protein n=1 Tax=Paenibacillus gyeongsangnamensis TaxID=3388067 RepID=A0ABT4Q4X9_9BACL|nr:hypothetical protein [Paenibacillus filicis]MCZ8511881.1 hypothetical protein [Paenibacillus filicis]